MIQLDLEVPDRPGEIAKVLDILGRETINIDAMSANSGAGHSYLSLIVDQPVKARQSLTREGYRCSQRSVVVISLPDTPGAFAALARKLGQAGVNIQSVVPLENQGERVQLALGVDNADAARPLV